MLNGIFVGLSGIMPKNSLSVAKTFFHYLCLNIAIEPYENRKHRTVLYR